MWILLQTPCSRHPVSLARPHLWVYSQITLWTAYKDGPCPKKVTIHSPKPYFWTMPMDIQVGIKDVYTSLPYSCPLFSPDFSNMSSHPAFQTSICSKEDYECLTGMSVIYSWIVLSSVESNIAGNLKYEAIKRNWNVTESCWMTHLTSLLGAEWICTCLWRFQHWSNRQLNCSLIICHFICVHGALTLTFPIWLWSFVCLISLHGFFLLLFCNFVFQIKERWFCYICMSGFLIITC